MEDALALGAALLMLICVLRLRHVVSLGMAAGEYEAFDDYLEMVIEVMPHQLHCTSSTSCISYVFCQFGYVVLFAAAFPLASILSVGCNMVSVACTVALQHTSQFLWYASHNSRLFRSKCVLISSSYAS